MIDNEKRLLLGCLVLTVASLSALAEGSTQGPLSGTVLTYASEVDGTLAVFEVAPDGSGRKELVPAAVARRGEYHPHVSRDGRWLSFTTYRYGGWKLALARRDGSEIARVTPTSHYAYDGDFSPDGEWIAYRRVETRGAPWFRGNLEIFAIRPDGSGERNLTRSPSEDENPSYSADGTRIVYQSFLPESENFEIFVMQADGSDQVNLTRSQAHEIAPAFSPDGKQIAFQRLVDDDRLELFIMNADGSGVRQLEGASSAAPKADPSGNDVWKFATTFSPDGRHIAFTGMADGDRELFTVGVDGKNLVRVTRHRGDDLHPVWTRRSR